jgi:hypothetical protein
MAKISGENARREQWFCLQGYFGSRSKPFCCPLGFDQFCPVLRQRTLRYMYIPAALFLALNKIASNLGGDMVEFMALSLKPVSSLR